MAPETKIPVIDIAVAGEREQARVAQELVDAAVEHGFIFIRNTGQDIPVPAVEGAFSLARALFASPLDEKERCSIQQNNRGWSGMQSETLDPQNQRVGDYKEVFNIGEFIDGKAQQPLPSALADHETQVSAFQDLCYAMCLKINTLLGIGLGVKPPSFFTTAHLRESGESGTTLRFLFYPPLTSTDASREDVRAGAHSDYGSITMLFRLPGQAGLEILTHDKTWAPVPVTPPGTEDDPAPPILVNIGDLLSYWTNGLLRSTVHRVVFPGKAGSAVAAGETDAQPRYSIAYFCHPVNRTRLTPVPSERVQKSGNLGGELLGRPHAERKDITADEYLQMRLRATFLQLYDEKE